MRVDAPCRRLRPALLSFSLILCSCALVRTVGIDSERNSYFPLAKGNEWDYRLVSTIRRGTRLDTTTIATYEHRIEGASRLADGKPALVRIWDSRVTLCDTLLPDSSFSQSETTYLRRSAHAVYRFLTRSSPPDSILVLPLEMDLKWQSYGVEYRVAGRDDVEIEGQTYPSCWRIRTGSRGDPNQVNTWYAKGVGLVRLVSDREIAGKALHTDYYLTRAQIR